jgi:segregation and condensation protein A
VVAIGYRRIVTTTDEAPRRAGFAVRVGEFEGPLDLLLSLIAKHELELTALALHSVTDDFLAYIRGQGDDWDLGEATEFLVVAATLLDLKASRLLPGDEVEDEEDLALLEARDLLFARLLQYRAYKQMSQHFATILEGPQPRVPRTAGLDPHLQGLLPEVELTVTPEELALLAVRAMTPVPPPVVSVAHVHGSAVSVRDQAALLADRLQVSGQASFTELIEDAPDRLHVVARFLAVLELFREALVVFDQPEPMTGLLIRWTGDPVGEVELGEAFDEFDEEPVGVAAGEMA